MRELDVYLHRERIGTLFPAGEGDCRFAYDPATVERAGAGTQLLSTALPVRREPFSNEATKAYIDGLLPNGRLRVQLARALGLDSGNSYGLLAELGGDCMGAVVFLPAGEPFPSEAGPIHWLDPGALEELVSGRPGTGFADPGADEEPRFCLPGIHHKLALTHDEASGRWCIPGPGLPSTHVVKPETGEFPDLVANELFCMAVARAADLPVAHTEFATIAGRPCLVSRRFDRAGHGASASRIHQEDFCQALGFPPGAAIPGASPGADGELDGDADGPGFTEATGLLKAVGQVGDIPVIIAAAFCNYALGNGDAHGKNFALLSGPGGLRLAPLYDLTSTVVYETPIHTGMVIGENYDDAAYLVELARTSEECGFDFEVFRQLAAVTAAKISDSLERVAARARQEGWHAPVIDQIVELAGDRAFGLAAEVEY